MTYQKTIPTKIGKITIAEQDGAIVALGISDAIPDGGVTRDTKLLNDAARQLTEYLDGRRQVFDLKLAPAGTDFQTRVWDELLKIPFGKTVSYSKIAAKIGRPRACRAVGGAVGKNPIPIIIPCHRVLAADGGIGGFSLGLPLKRKLLGLESA